MKLWMLTNFNYDEDQERSVEFFARRKEALDEYENGVPDSKHDSFNTVLKVELVETCSDRTVALLNRRINVIRVVKDWATDPRRAEVDKEEE